MSKTGSGTRLLAQLRHGQHPAQPNSTCAPKHTLNKCNVTCVLCPPHRNNNHNPIPKAPLRQSVTTVHTPQPADKVRKKHSRVIPHKQQQHRLSCQSKLVSCQASHPDQQSPPGFTLQPPPVHCSAIRSNIRRLQLLHLTSPKTTLLLRLLLHLRMTPLLLLMCLLLLAAQATCQTLS